MYRRSQLTNFEFVQACTLHLLDMHWQKYDLPFLVEVNLPQFYIDLAKCELRLCMPRDLTSGCDACFVTSQRVFRCARRWWTVRTTRRSWPSTVATWSGCERAASTSCSGTYACDVTHMKVCRSFLPLLQVRTHYAQHFRRLHVTRRADVCGALLRPARRRDHVRRLQQHAARSALPMSAVPGHGPVLGVLRGRCEAK